MPERPDVFFFEAFAEEATALTRCLPAGLSAGFTDATIQESGRAAPPAAVISTRTQSVIPTGWAPDLTALLTRSTGYDHLAAFRDRAGAPDVECGYLPLYCNRAVAEQAMLLWMALLRRLPQQVRQFDRFERDGLTGAECLGRTLTVVGVGNIGSEVARLGLALGMRVLCVDIVERFDQLNYVALEQGIEAADIIVCAMNLTEANRGLFDEQLLRRVRPGTIFVNIARGELADTGALLRLLDEGILGGAGLDVYDREPELAVSLRAGTPSSDPTVGAVLALRERADVICTPHNAFNTVESVERKARQSVEQLEHLRRHGTFKWPLP
jgi:D-lactate dehydrogenase